MMLKTTRLAAGFSLVELTVAMAIYSMGVGGISIMLLAAVHGTADAGYQTYAASEASSLAEMILMNSDAIGHYVNPAPSNPGACQFDQVCSPADMASANMNSWRLQLRNNLPGGRGLVCRDGTPDDGQADKPSCDGAGNPVIKLFWEEPGKPEDGRNYSQHLVTRLPLP